MKPLPDTPEFARFTAAMQKIMKVSKVELDRRVAAAHRPRKPKTSGQISNPSPPPER